MHITIENPLPLNEKGPRQYNQDSLFPNRVLADDADRLFIVCDGVGGAKFGEVASRLACDALATYFIKHRPEVSDEIFWRKAFLYTNQRFDHWFALNPDHKGMATTAVVLHIHDMGFTVAHCGDSRLCQFRNGQLIWKTTDHTPINDQLRNGLITPDEAALLPHSSSISRAFQGEATASATPEVTVIESVEPGDYLLLCSDGVWGCYTDAELAEILFAVQPDKEKIETIHLLCEANASDNYTAWLIAVAAVDGKIRQLINATAVQPVLQVDAAPREVIINQALVANDGNNPLNDSSFTSIDTAVEATDVKYERITAEPTRESLPLADEDMAPQQAEDQACDAPNNEKVENAESPGSVLQPSDFRDLPFKSDQENRHHLKEEKELFSNKIKKLLRF